MGEKQTHLSPVWFDFTPFISNVRVRALNADQIFIMILNTLYFRTQSHTHKHKHNSCINQANEWTHTCMHAARHARTSHQHSILLWRRRRRCRCYTFCSFFILLFFPLCCWRLFLVYFYIKCWIFVVSRQHFRAHAHTANKFSFI